VAGWLAGCPLGQGRQAVDVRVLLLHMQRHALPLPPSTLWLPAPAGSASPAPPAAAPLAWAQWLCRSLSRRSNSCTPRLSLRAAMQQPDKGGNIAGRQHVHMRSRCGSLPPPPPRRATPFAPGVVQEERFVAEARVGCPGQRASSPGEGGHEPPGIIRHLGQRCRRGRRGAGGGGGHRQGGSGLARQAAACPRPRCA